MEKILFIGGTKGSGKSNLCNMLSREVGVGVLNTGDFFSLYSDSRQDVKKKIVLSITQRAPIIVDTHYAGFVDDEPNEKFERALSVGELETLSKGIDIYPVLIDLDPVTLMNRRFADKSTIRDQNVSHMAIELEQTRIHFLDYCRQLKVNGFVIENYDLQKSFKFLVSVYKWIFG